MKKRYVYYIDGEDIPIVYDNQKVFKLSPETYAILEAIDNLRIELKEVIKK